MREQRPGGLLAVATLAIALGGLGGCGGLWGIGQMLFQDPILAQQRGLYEGLGFDAEEVARQEEIQDALLEPTRRWRPALLAHQIANLMASGALLWAGLLLLRTHRHGPRLFLGTALANFVVDAAGAVVGLVVSFNSQEAWNRFAGQIAPHADPASGEALAQAVKRASLGVGVCFAGGWLLVKLAIYVGGVVYLRRPVPRRLFAEGAQSSSSGGGT